ncbi:hypothetical protein NPIL_244831 [Nephila pilipes]|uniref:Uncharacterized protein n=1 Tax=Nephila pilipes TaxID=299642 RepID=A0A8X6JCV2_NEPPI|nr:hypothetical protein NPIL_244831 [Nephila pilipes]
MCELELKLHLLHTIENSLRCSLRCQLEHPSKTSNNKHPEIHPPQEFQGDFKYALRRQPKFISPANEIGPPQKGCQLQKRRLCQTHATTRIMSANSPSSTEEVIQI